MFIKTKTKTKSEKSYIQEKKIQKSHMHIPLWYFTQLKFLGLELGVPEK